MQSQIIVSTFADMKATVRFSMIQRRPDDKPFVFQSLHALDTNEMKSIAITNEAGLSTPSPSETKSAAEERRFLEGPNSRITELFRAFRIFREIIRGFRRLHFVGPCVTVFGSARYPETHPYYLQAREIGAELAKSGFTVMTGGGPGIMEAANRGAKDVNGRSVGCNIVLPKEQQPNPYLDLFVDFRYFFVRKLMLAKYSYAFVAMPGGFGTLDELFEIATLVQTGKVKEFPIVLAGVDYWKPLLEFLRDTMVAGKTIDQVDVDRFIVSDSPKEIAHLLSEAAKKKFGLEHGVLKPKWWLLESMPFKPR
jgi:uncharacterized protein (TIGR00730 family)